MIFYHGSKRIIDKPIAKGSNYDNDYGPSFYLTIDYESAKEWACKNNEAGIVNKYSIRNHDFDSLKILDLTGKDEKTILTWLAILMHFRKVDNSVKTTFKNRIDWLEKYYIDVTQYDVIKGFRADDSYFKFPIKFIARFLSYENLINVFKLGNLGIQYAFMSQEAIEKLKFVSYEKCDQEYVGRYYEIVKKASEQFEIIINQPLDDNDTFITDLMEKDNE
ncbi:MAG: DUF3990 domain-containing protein [Bacilli bacterium]|nr:DUF3990 domain-containing protein [Bacilli bacterium]